MEFEINTTAKSITISKEVNFGELVNTLQELLPQDWPNYKIVSKHTIQLKDNIKDNNWVQPYKYVGPPVGDLNNVDINYKT